MEKVTIHLIGDKEYAYFIARSLSQELKLNWKEYPTCVEERTAVTEGQVVLCATASRRISKIVERSLMDFLEET